MRMKFGKHFGKVLKKTVFTTRYNDKDWNKDVLGKETILMSEEYGFSKLEIRHIIKYKPTFLLFEEDYEKEKKGIKALKEVLCSDHFGFSLEIVKNLVVKYPTILSKS